MDDSALIRYYVEKSKEWIFQRSNRNYRIEDDEILDLDSLSLDSNEDTWLYSSDEKTAHGSHEMIYDNEEVTSPPFSSSNFVDEVTGFNADSSHSISSMSPLIDVNNWSDSLIHIPDVSLATIDNFLAITPVDDRKSKSYFRSALSNQFHSSRTNTESQFESNSPLNKCKTEYNAFQTFGSTFTPSNESSKFTTRKPFTNSNEGVDKSSILHSVENKLFTITDADSSDTLNFYCRTNQQSHELAPNDYIKRSDSQKKSDHGAITTALSDCAITHSSEYKAVDVKTTNECDKKFGSSRTVKIDPLKSNTSLNACENDENDRRSTTKKHMPICQSTPMLLNRYLKYNKSIEDDKNYSKWRTSSEFLKADTKKMEYVIDKNELNVSYVKHASNDSIENYTSPSEDETNKTNSNLNTTYSKSEGLLNSTYDVHEEDDQISTASESSVSSLSSKPSSAIRDVQKMAQLQERSLQKQFHFSCGAESSKSSEISSSNESVSAFSPVSSSNEGQIDLKTCNAYSSAQRAYHQSRKPFTPNASVYSSQTTNIRSANSATCTQHRVSGEEKHSANSSKGSRGHDITFKCKPFTVNGDSPPFLQNQPKSTKDEQNLKNTSSVNRPPVAKSNSKECAPATENSQHLTESKPNVRGIPFVSKLLSFKTVEQSDSSSPPKESRTRDVGSKMNRPLRCASPGPASHIPRPSSRIPKPRTSASCTRYSRTSFSSSKK